MPRFVNIDRETGLLLPPDLREWVPASDVVHLVIEAVEQMDCSQARVNERGTGSEQFPPSMLLALLIYCYAQGIYSSRRIEQATYTHVGVRYLTGDTHPDHDTIATFRRTNLALLRQAFAEVLQLARQLGVLRVGTVYLDGTKIKANASARANRREDQLRAELAAIDAEVAQRVQSAQSADETEVAEQLPVELTDRRARKAKLQAARAALRQRAEEQERTPKDEDLGNTTDPDSRRHHTRNGPLQGYNAQIAATDNGLVVAAHVCTDNQDRRQLVPTVQQVAIQIESPQVVVADTGYDSHEQIVAVEQRFGATVYIPPQPPFEVHSRQTHARARRSKERAQRLERVRTELGQQLLKRRSTTVEPIFGILKCARGFNRFLLRGLEAVDAEWALLCTAFNLRRLHRLLAQPA